MTPPLPKTIHYFGDYVLFGQIASGAMGEVWFARQESLGRPVAIKLIRAGALATRTEVERFEVEASAAARLSHKNIVRVFEVGQQDGRHFLSMELIEGGSLATQIKEGLWRLTPTNARARQRHVAGFLATIARAVHHAHQRGVLHRDIKPANILIDEQGEPHLSDFGLAKLLDTEASLTQPGAVLGTLSYMSPEQAAGKSAEATIASDIYSLGAVLYELLAGQPPFRGDEWTEMIRQVTEVEPIPPRKLAWNQAVRGGPVLRNSREAERPSTASEAHSDDGDRQGGVVIDGDLETICLKCLEKAPGRRYATAEDLAEDLERWQRGEPILARPVGDLERAWKWVRRHPVAVGLSAALMLALLGGLVTTTWQWRRAEHQRALTTRAHQRLQLQRAEDFFASEKAPLALPILARVLRDDPDHRIAQERLVNALNQRGILVPLGLPDRVSSAAGQLAMRVTSMANAGQIATSTNLVPAIELWDTRSGALLRSVSSAHSNVIRNLTSSPDGRRLISSSADATAKIWDAATLELITTLPHPMAVHSGEFSPDGAQVVTACRDGVARLWEVRTGRLRLALPVQRTPLNMVRFHPDGSLLATGADDGAVQLWTVTESSARRLTDALSLSNAVWDLKFTSNSVRATLDDGTTIALGWTRPASPSPAPALISSGAPQLPQPVSAVLGRPAAEFHAEPITCAATSPDGRLVATASLDQTARLWNVRTFAPAAEPLVHNAPVNWICFSPDGLRVATSTPGGEVRVWSAATGQPLTDEIRFASPVASVVFSADNAFVETSSGQTWPVHCAREAAPRWLCELGETLGGTRWDEAGRALPAAPLSALQDRIAGLPETDPLARWAKRLLAGAPSPRR